MAGEREITNTMREAIARALEMTFVGEHTGGGDSLLPRQDRGGLADWVPDTPLTVGEVAALLRMQCAESETDRAVMGVEAALWQRYADWAAEHHPEWPEAAVNDVSFRPLSG